MTVQTKCFIELSDIVALRFDCKKCKTITIFPVEEFRDMPHICPNCEQEFYGFHDNVTKHTMREFVKAIRAVNAMTEKGGFLFSLQTSGPST